MGACCGLNNTKTSTKNFYKELKPKQKGEKVYEIDPRIIKFPCLYDEGGKNSDTKSKINVETNKNTLIDPNPGKTKI